MSNRAYRRISVYRDDSTTPIVYEPVKSIWWEEGNTVLVIAYITDVATGAHDYFHLPRERIAWFRDEKLKEAQP